MGSSIGSFGQQQVFTLGKTEVPRIDGKDIRVGVLKHRRLRPTLVTGVIFVVGTLRP